MQRLIDLRNVATGARCMLRRKAGETSGGLETYVAKGTDLDVRASLPSRFSEGSQNNRMSE